MTTVVEFTQDVEVTVDESKFTPDFMEEFRRYFYDFDTIGEHVEHLAQLAGRGVIETPCFIDGYGLSADMGIIVKVL